MEIIKTRGWRSREVAAKNRADVWAYCVEHPKMPQFKIAEALGLSRFTVRKYQNELKQAGRGGSGMGGK